MKIAVVPNFDKIDAGIYTEKILSLLQDHSAEILMHQKDAGKFPGVAACRDHEDMISQCDVVIAVGGDGTIIHTAKHASVHEKPILGVNLGRLGFLCDVEKDCPEEINKLFSGAYSIRKRMMLEITVESANGTRQYHALNDAVISGAQSKIFDFDLSVNDSEGYHFRADGLILATPTGSTAYSLSSGGPVVDPEIECILFTPICPHSLFNRSTVFSADKVLKVSADSEYTGEVYLTVDGDTPVLLHSTDTVSIRRSERYTKSVIVQKRDFYDIVNRKFILNRG